MKSDEFKSQAPVCPLCHTAVAETFYDTVPCRYCPRCHEAPAQWSLGSPVFAVGDKVAVATKTRGGDFQLRRLAVRSVTIRALNHPPLYQVALDGDDRPWRFESELLQLCGTRGSAGGWKYSPARHGHQAAGWGIVLKGQVIGLSVLWSDSRQVTPTDEARCWRRASEATGHSIADLQHRGGRLIRIRIATQRGGRATAWRPTATPALTHARQTLAAQLAAGRPRPATQRKGTA